MPEPNPNSITNKAYKELELLFNSISDDIGRAVRRYGIKYKTPFWKNNKRLYNAVNKSLKALNDKSYTVIKNSIKNSWNLSNDRMDKLVIDYIKQYDPSDLLSSKAYEGISEAELISLGVPVLEEWVISNTPQLNAFLNRSVDGLKLSGRVWKTTVKARRMIEETLKSGILEGRSANEMSRILRQSLKNPNALFRRVKDPITGELKLSKPAQNYNPGRGVYRSAFKNARRITATETNMSYRFAENERINQIPFVIGYRVHLSDAHPVYDICDSMIGMYPKNFVFIGWHPHCFCYTTTVMLSDEKFKKFLDTGKIPSTNYVQKMPNMAVNYINENKESISKMKTKPYWLRHNETVIKKQTK